MRRASGAANSWEKAESVPAAASVTPTAAGRETEAQIEIEDDERVDGEAAAGRVEGEQRGEADHDLARLVQAVALSRCGFVARRPR